MPRTEKEIEADKVIIEAFIREYRHTHSEQDLVDTINNSKQTSKYMGIPDVQAVKRSMGLEKQKGNQHHPIKPLMNCDRKTIKLLSQKWGADLCLT